MKLIALFAIYAVAVAAPRQKRLAIGTIAISGQAAGSTGCVVTGNVLYINGLKQGELTSDQQQEMADYTKNLDQYKQELKDAIAAKQKALEARMKGRKNVGSTKEMAQQQDQTPIPKPPARPSFCQQNDTTQYIFDGCMIQNNKVYVGREYARDLTPEEVQELQEFDKEQTVYQKYVQDQVQKQVDGLFGSSNLFSALFNDGTERQTTTAAPSTTTGPAPEAPKVPNFCTAIY